MATSPTDPYSPQALSDGNTYSQAVKDRIAEMLRNGAGAVGNAILGGNTGNDSTGAGQDAYRAYAEQATAAGRQPLSIEQWSMANRPFN